MATDRYIVQDSDHWVRSSAPHDLLTAANGDRNKLNYLGAHRERHVTALDSGDVITHSKTCKYGHFETQLFFKLMKVSD